MLTNVTGLPGIEKDFGYGCEVLRCAAGLCARREMTRRANRGVSACGGRVATTVW